MLYCIFFFFLMIRRPPRSTLDRSSAASDVYKRQAVNVSDIYAMNATPNQVTVSIAISNRFSVEALEELYEGIFLSLIHISEPTRPY